MRRMAFVTGRAKRAIEDHFVITCELDQVSGTSKKERLGEIRALIRDCIFYTRQC